MIACARPGAPETSQAGGTRDAPLMIMKYVKRLLMIAPLVAMVGSCYVETRGPRYAHRDWHSDCRYDGYHCHRR